MADFDTVANIVSDSAVELGLDSVSDVYASTDANIIQLRALLKTVGKGLARVRYWTALTQRVTFNTSAGGNINQTVATDFDEMIPGTFWDETNDRELYGPITEADWEFLLATGASTSLRTPWRQWAGSLYLYGAPAAATLAYQHRSLWWVAVTAAPSTCAKGAPTLNTDVVLFDRNLVVAALKLAWTRLKGFDTSGVLDEYKTELQQACAADSPARTLRMDGTCAEPFLSERSTPITGIGS